MIYTVLVEEERRIRRKQGRAGRRDEEEGGTRMKEGRGGRGNKEEGATERVKQWKSCKKNEKLKSGLRTYS